MGERKRDSLPLLLLLPNVVTIIGLSAGLTSIRFALLGRFDLAAMLIIFAAVIDGLDGLLARRLNAASPMGAELDSLSDFLAFGVAPALLMFQFALEDRTGRNWIFVLIYAICACLRLARFNVNRDAPPPPGRPSFTGVPAPGGAMLALLPLFLTLVGAVDAPAWPLACGLWLMVVGLLMTSRVPTISSKALRIPREKAKLVLIGAAVVAGLLFTRFWLLMALATALYAALVAWAVVAHIRAGRAGR